MRNASRLTTADSQAVLSPSRLRSRGLKHLRAKLVFSIGLLCLLCLTLPGSLRADTVYTYACTSTGTPQCSSNPTSYVEVSSGLVLSDVGQIDEGRNYNASGSWMVTTVPEPCTWLLLGTGLLCLLALAARSKRLAPSAS
jgi:hypothetical protein